jgi:hypothetical protein
MSRCIGLHLPTIDPEARKREKSFMKEFEVDRPRIFGALLDAVARGLRDMDTFKLKNPPRMADAWYWISALEPHFGWERGSTLKYFHANQKAANGFLLESSAIFKPLCELAKQGWSDTATRLLAKLKEINGDPNKVRSWPKDAKALSDKVRRLAPQLREQGIDIHFSKTSGKDSKRIVTIKQNKRPFDACDASDAKRSCDDRDVGDAEKSNTGPKGV